MIRVRWSPITGFAVVPHAAGEAVFKCLQSLHNDINLAKGCNLKLVLQFGLIKGEKSAAFDLVLAELVNGILLQSHLVPEPFANVFHSPALYRHQETCVSNMVGCYYVVVLWCGCNVV